MIRIRPLELGLFELKGAWVEPSRWKLRLLVQRMIIGRILLSKIAKKCFT